MKQRYPDIGQQAAQNRGPYREEHQLGVSYEFPERSSQATMLEGGMQTVWLRTSEAEFKAAEFCRAEHWRAAGCTERGSSREAPRVSLESSAEH